MSSTPEKTLRITLPTQGWLLGLVIALLFFGLSRSLARKRPKMPPGPPRWIFGDNRHQVPKLSPWKTFTDWKLQYGSVVSFYLGRTPVVVLGTAEAAWDLLEKRGDIYSSRPRFIIGGEILSGGMRGIGMPYGERWRKWRKLIHSGLNGRIALNYRPLQSLETKVFLNALLEDAEKWETHLERLATSIMVSITYGRRITTLDDPIVTANRAVQAYFGKVHMPGKYIVESWPILLKLPRRLQWFRWDPEHHRAHDTALYLAMQRSVKDKMAAGIARTCLATHALDPDTHNDLSEVQTAFALSAPFSAGVGTTVSALKVGLLAMLHYPQVVAKAQAQLDAVLGHDRMPEFEDADSLPYVQAFVKETLRWRTVSPTGTPHATISDDLYNGYFIPKGSTIYPNIYAMTRDPVMFSEPDVFRPERFLNTTNPRLIDFDLVFGFGRRICPGMHVASQTLFVVLARILWAFDVVPAADAKTGVRVLPDPDKFTNGLVIRPQPFKCDFRPRRAEIIQMIKQEVLEAESHLGSWS